MNQETKIQQHPNDVLLVDEQEAARMLGYTVRTLRNWRFKGRGPRFVRVNARSIRYRIQDLEAWIEFRIVQSTKEKLPDELR